MKLKPPTFAIDKEVQKLKKKLEIIEAEFEFWKEIDDEVQKRTNKNFKTNPNNDENK
jgi:hypothetical protein